MGSLNKLFYIDCEIQTLTTLLKEAEDSRKNKIKEEILLLKRKRKRLEKRSKGRRKN